MAPSDIQAAFFNGQPFTASTPGGTQFKMIFTPDRKMTREPLGKSGYKGSGTWKLDATGFCTSWARAKTHALHADAAAQLRGMRRQSLY
jgi:hypothetical protein